MDYEQRAARLVEVVRTAASHARNMHNPDLAATFDTIALQVTQARFPVLVCGEFKRGKSSLVGALLGDPSLCPVEIDIATNVVTAIEYGAPERIEVRLADRSVTIDRDAIAGYVTEAANPGNRLGVESISIVTPNERLRSGLVLFDTPGVGGVNAAHSALTYALLPAAVAAIFVADVIEPLSASELAFAARALSHVERVLVVLTRADLIVDPSIAIEDAQRKLAPLLGTTPDAVEVVAVSNLGYLDYLSTNDPADLEASNFPELESALRDLVEKDRARVLIERSASQTRDALDRLRAPLVTERAAYADQSRAASEELERQLAESDARLAALSGESAEWRKTLALRLEDARLDAVQRLAIAWANLESTFSHDYLNDAQLLKAPERVLAVLERDIALIVADLEKHLASVADAICEDMAGMSGLRLDTGYAGQLHVEAATPTARPVTRKDSLFDRSFVVVRNAGMGASPVGLMTTFLGGAAVASMPAWLPYVIAAAGVTAGVRLALAQLRREERQAQQEAVRATCRPYLSEVHARAGTELTRAIRALERTLAGAFDAQLNEERNVVAASRKALGEARGRTKAEATARAAELDRALAPLQALQTALAAIATSTASIPELASVSARGESWADA